LDLQQQRIEKAAGEELKQTQLVIKKTGLFDNIDKLYGEVSGATTGQATTTSEPPLGGDMGGLDMGSDMGSDMGGAPPPPPPPAEPPAGETQGEPGLAPESRIRNLNILVENNYINGPDYIKLTKGQNSLNEIEEQLKKLLK